MTLAAGTPWKPLSRSGSTPYSSHHRIHERSTAAIESMSVPSMSSSTPANGASKGGGAGSRGGGRRGGAADRRRNGTACRPA